MRIRDAEWWGGSGVVGPDAAGFPSAFSILRCDPCSPARLLLNDQRDRLHSHIPDFELDGSIPQFGEKLRGRGPGGGNSVERDDAVKARTNGIQFERARS